MASRADNCYDNAFMESCFETIMTELEMTEHENHGAAMSAIESYIAYYNLPRIHLALGYLTPAQFESLNQPPNYENHLSVNSGPPQTGFA